VQRRWLCASLEELKPAGAQRDRGGLLLLLHRPQWTHPHSHTAVRAYEPLTETQSCDIWVRWEAPTYEQTLRTKHSLPLRCSPTTCDVCKRMADGAELSTGDGRITSGRVHAKQAERGGIDIARWD
jgi:hypothetical protein